jgi:hypothetical protein
VHRLGPALGQVKYREPAMAEANLSVPAYPMTISIGPAMTDDLTHPAQDFEINTRLIE